MRRRQNLHVVKVYCINQADKFKIIQTNNTVKASKGQLLQTGISEDKQCKMRGQNKSQNQ